MQFNILSIVLAAATLAAATPTGSKVTDNLETRTTCLYPTASYTSWCKAGVCQGTPGVCSGNGLGDYTESVDATAAAANVAACVGIANSKGCVQTAACCK